MSSSKPNYVIQASKALTTISSWLEKLRGSADFFPVAGLALTAQVALPQSMDAMATHCKITNGQNKSFLPGKYLGQLDYRPPTVKSRGSHEVFEIGEMSTRRSIQLVKQDRSPLFTKLNAIGLTP